MALIRVENTYSWLTLESEETKTKLWKALRFRKKGYNFNAAYKMKAWDGFIDFFDKKNGKFLTGILPEITAALEHWDISYSIQDTRPNASFAISTVDEKWLEGKELYDYQVDYINQAIKLKRGLVGSVTGSGKTFVMVGIIQALIKDTPTLVLCNQTDLVEQNYQEIKKFGFENVGRLHGTKKELDFPIICATWQSLSNIKHLLPKIECVIVDEIHVMMSPKLKLIYKLFKNATIRIGLSATAFKFGGTDIVQKYETKGYFGLPFFVKSVEGGKPTTKKLQERNILSLAEFTFFKINEPYLQHEIYQEAVVKGIVENQYLQDIIVDLCQKLKGRILIMVQHLKHGDLLKQRLPNAAWISGKDDRASRQHVIDRLKYDNDVIAIATTGISSAGINVFIHGLINASGGQADHAVIQRLGRGLRTADDKDVLQYFDFYFTNNHYLENHSRKRVKILQSEGHVIKIEEKYIFTEVV